MTMVTDRMADAASDPGAYAHAAVSVADVSDYVSLLKPRVMSLVVFTALVGMVVGKGQIHPVIGFASLLAIAVGAGASGCLNMWWDADIDAKMTRTCRRAIPAGRVKPGEALAFGVTLAAGSVLFLGIVANWFAAAFLAFTIFFYVVVYSMLLKRSTAQNIVIGGAAGAFPPMIGEAAVTGSLSLETTILFLIIFLWTPPHFWALALVKSADYARAGVPMLPNVAGPDATRRQILAYTMILTPCACLPVVAGFGGLAYAFVAVVAGLAMVGLALRLQRQPQGDGAARAAQHLFGFSILYLFLLFAALLAEHGFGLGASLKGALA
jgi:heme o synthase